MSRLTKRFTDGTFYAEDIEEVGIEGINYPTYVGKVVDKLADYEDKQEQGLLIELPIAIGSDVYYIPSKVNYDLNVLHHREEFNRVYHQKIVRLHFTESVWFGEGDLNLQYGLVDRIFVSRSYKETWFTTRSEAEEALARMKGE